MGLYIHFTYLSQASNLHAVVAHQQSEITYYYGNHIYLLDKKQKYTLSFINQRHIADRYVKEKYGRS